MSEAGYLSEAQRLEQTLRESGIEVVDIDILVVGCINPNISRTPLLINNQTGRTLSALELRLDDSSCTGHRRTGLGVSSSLPTKDALLADGTMVTYFVPPCVAVLQPQQTSAQAQLLTMMTSPEAHSMAEQLQKVISERSGDNVLVLNNAELQRIGQLLPEGYGGDVVCITINTALPAQSNSCQDSKV